MNGAGYVMIDLLAIFFCFLAALCQLAIYMDRGLNETKAVDASRMLMFVGYVIVGVRWAYLLMASDFDLRINPVLVLGVLFTALAQVIMAADRLINGNRECRLPNEA